jgi:hypothetical protein
MQQYRPIKCINIIFCVKIINKIFLISSPTPFKTLLPLFDQINHINQMNQRFRQFAILPNSDFINLTSEIKKRPEPSTSEPSFIYRL